MNSNVIEGDNKVEYLMKPRFKLISDYPHNFQEIGTIFYWNEFYEFFHPLNSEVNYSKEIENYPAIFKKLEWWEERKPEELPKYIKSHSGQVTEVKEWSLNAIGVLYNKIQWRDELNDNQYYKSCEPATEQEYLNQHE